jgi:hypothetical protein
LTATSGCPFSTMEFQKITSITSIKFFYLETLQGRPQHDPGGQERDGQVAVQAALHSPQDGARDREGAGGGRRLAQRSAGR